MNMTSESQARILQTYELISPRIDEMVVDFYQRLFSHTPSLRAMFRDDMTIQRQHFAATLALLVRNLQFQEALTEPLMDLGVQHLRLGTRPEQYPIVRDCLLGSIAKALGEKWTPEVENDWTQLLDHVVTAMLRGTMLYALKTITR
jgi:hemoglobin-like flavoprotein